MENILAIYGIIVVIIFFETLIEAKGDIKSMASTPFEFYEMNNLNIVTNCLLFLLWFAINPIYVIVRFIDWLVHVGRKD